MANNFDMYYNKSVLSEFSYSSRNLFRDSMNSKGKSEGKCERRNEEVLINGEKNEDVVIERMI